MRRGLLRLGVVVWTVGAAAVGVAPTVARADAPVAQGWWTVANPGGLPANPADAAADVPKGGLLIQAGPTEPTAYAGLVYELPKDKTASELTLKVAPNTATTPVAALQICALVTPTLDIEQGGPISDAPDYDCQKSAKASLDAGGSTFKFTVTSLVSESTLAIAIIPGDNTSRVVLSKPDESSLATTPSLTGDSYTSGTPTTTDAPSSAPTTEETTSSSDPAPVSAPNVGAGPPATGSSAPAADDPAPVVAPDPSDQQSAAPIAAQPVAATSDAGGRSGIAVLILVAALGAGAVLWAMAGRAPIDAVTEA